MGNLSRRQIITLVTAAATVVALVIGVVWFAGGDDKPAQNVAEVRVDGPAGDAFFTPPADARDAAPGTPIWARSITTGADMRGYDLLYWSRSVSDKPVAVSALVYTPASLRAGTAAPIVSWAHGSTGLDDACAPTEEPEPISAPSSL